MDLIKLNDFLSKAVLATYTSDGIRIKSDKKGFIDLEHLAGDFYYRDSNAGYLSSHVQETIWYQDKPVWMCLYAGGMRGSKMDDVGFANQTFELLKKVMRAGKKNIDFEKEQE